MASILSSVRERLQRPILVTLSIVVFVLAVVASGAVTQSDVYAWILHNWLAVLLLCAAALLLLLAASPQRDGRVVMPPIRPISMRAVVAGLLVATLCAWLSVHFLLNEASLASATQRAGLRIDAIRTGVTIGIGVGGAVTLLLAARKQWLGERSQAHTEEDAVERRVTDLYAKAIDQLGSNNAAVRLGGVYALERLAKQHVAIRQSVVNVLCAYLRMMVPIGCASRRDELETNAGVDAFPTADQERHVRLAIQEVLFNNLRRNHGGQERSAWPEIDLNLRGAYLNNVDLSDCEVRSLEMAACHLFGKSNFDKLHVIQNASFDKTIFKKRTTFFDVIFGGAASFKGAQFKGDTPFVRVNFFGDAMFEKARFVSEHCWFAGCTFHEGAEFSKAKFYCTADFSETTFSASMVFFDRVQWLGNAYFHGSHFKGITHIIQCKFAKDCQFSKVHFHDSARFDGSDFLGKTYFCETEFNGAWFSGAVFVGAAYFNGAQVEKLALFDRSKFEDDLVLTKACFAAKLDLSHARLLAELQAENATFSAGVDLDDALLSNAAFNAVNDLWSSQWNATRVPYENNGLIIKFNRMSHVNPAETSGGTAHCPTDS